eukprot:scaffold202_cov213-Chaetoceros_neogracile.AAC.7
MEELNACLGNLFLGPSQGIEQAFKLVLALLQQQDDKGKMFAKEHEQIKKQNQLLLENMKNLQDSNFVCSEKLKECEKMAILHEEVALEMKQLHKSFEEIKDVQSQSANDLDEIKEEMKVMAFNLRLDHREDLDLQMQSLDSSVYFCEDKLRGVTSDQMSYSANQKTKSETRADDKLEIPDATSADKELKCDAIAVAKQVKCNIILVSKEVKEKDEITSGDGSPKVEIDDGDETLGIEPIDTNVRIQEENNVLLEVKAETSYELKAETSYEPKAEILYEPKAETLHEPKAETSYEPKAKILHVPKAEASHEPKVETSYEPKAETPYEPKAKTSYEPKAKTSYESKSERTLLIAPLAHQDRRRWSTASSRKLRVDETLASRLERLEADKITLRAEMADIKKLLANKCSTSDTTHALSSGDSLTHVERRVSIVEDILTSFGSVYNSDSESTSENTSNIQMASTGEAPGFADSDVSDSDVHELNLGSDSNDDYESFANDCVDHVLSSKDELTLVGTQSSSVSDSTFAEEEARDKNDPDIHLFMNDTSDNQDIKTTHVPLSDGSSEPRLYQDKKDSKASGEVALPECQQTSAKQKGLLLHILDQESKLKENVSHISSRLAELESNCENRVSRKSMEDYFALKTIHEEAVSSEIESGASFVDGVESSPVQAHELESIRSSIEQLIKDLDSKVSMEVFKKEIESYLFQPAEPAEDLSGTLERPIIPDQIVDSLHQYKTNVQQQLQFLNDKKIDEDTLSEELSKKSDSFTAEFNSALNSYESRTIETLNIINYDVNECKKSIEDLQNQTHYANSRSDDMNMDIDERIRSATEAVQSNFNSIISSRLEGIKAVEDEMEKVTSHLAEKPDQAQINKMLQDLERSVLKHVGVDDTVKSALANVKTDLKQKLTKHQVLDLVKQLLHGAKEGITKTNSDSLMVGYKCIGCNEACEGGVNKSRAVKVNHNALPLGRPVVIPVFPYCRPSSNAKPGYSNTKRNLTPLTRRPSFGTFGHRGPRPRPRTSPNQITHRKTK